MSEPGRAGADDGSSADETPSYCSNCGNALDAGDRYCSDCGEAVRSVDSAADESDGPSTDGDEDERARREFRRRVGDYLADGWEIQYDAGDEVVLVDRGFGSIGVHVLLLIFTSGIGNLLYAWYNYQHDADRMVLREGESPKPVSEATDAPVDGAGDVEEGASFSRYAAGLVMLLTGVYVIGTSLLSFGPLLFGLGLVLLSLLVLPPTRRRIRDRHPPTTFGPAESVEERSVAGTDRLCSICREPIDRGVVREYKKDYVFVGLPLYSIEAGENWYCDSCHTDHRSAASELGGFADSLDVDDSRDEDAEGGDRDESQESGESDDREPERS